MAGCKSRPGAFDECIWVQFPEAEKDTGWLRGHLCPLFIPDPERPGKLRRCMKAMCDYAGHRRNVNGMNVCSGHQEWELWYDPVHNARDRSTEPYPGSQEFRSWRWDTVPDPEKE